MGSSNRLAKTISFVASLVYLLFILLQIPLFRVPCRCGFCTSPIQVTCSQLTAYKILPIQVSKLLLYPNDIFFKKTSFSKYYSGSFRKCEMTYGKKNIHASIAYDIRQLEITVGCYLCVSGAFLGLPKRGRVSLFGMLLLWWGFSMEAIIGSRSTSNAVEMYTLPMLSALLMSFLGVRRDMKRIVKSFRARYKKAHAKISFKIKQK